MASPLPPPLEPGVHLQLFFPHQHGTKYQAGQFCIVRQLLMSFLSDASVPVGILVAAWSRRAAPEERKKMAVRPCGPRLSGPQPAWSGLQAACFLPRVLLWKLPIFSILPPSHLPWFSPYFPPTLGLVFLSVAQLVSRCVGFIPHPVLMLLFGISFTVFLGPAVLMAQARLWPRLDHLL